MSRFFPAVLAVLVSPAAAEGIVPRYDPETYCDKIAAFGGDYSESTKESCLDMEQSAYDSLKDRWSEIPDRMQAYCDKVARFGGSGSYSTLQSCIDMEEEAKDKTARKKFRF